LFDTIKENRKDKKINENSPNTIASTVYINGRQKKKKFKAIGYAKYDKNIGAFELKLSDYIFKSHISSVYLENEKLCFYFPVEKKMFVDNIKTVQLKNYLDVDFEFLILFRLFVGEIPIIPNSNFKKCKLNKNEICDYLQRISFKNGNPDKVLYIKKSTKAKFEVYLSKLSDIRGVKFYKKIRVKSRSDSINISFGRLKINKKVKVESAQKIINRKKLKIIEMR